MGDSRHLEWALVVGQRVRRLRLDQGMTLPELARRVRRPETGEPWSGSYLSRLERGWANAPLYLYLELARELGVDQWRLFAPDECLLDVSAAERTVLDIVRRLELAPDEAIIRLTGLR